jgi:hypothetical protein
MARSAAGGDMPVSAALDALAARMGLGLLLIDAAARPLFCSHTARELLDCREAGSLAERWAALQAVKSADPGTDAAAPHTFTADLPCDGSTRFLRGQIRPSAGGFEVLLKDRRSLGAVDLELLCASRMREWIHQCDELVHDANGALNTIQLTLELLDGRWPGQRAGEQSREPQRSSHVGVIRDNLEKLKDTLRQFVNAHDPVPASADFDLRDVVKQAAATLRMPARRRRIDLQIRCGDAALAVRGNRARIRQALVDVALSRVGSLAERSRLAIEANAHDGVPEIVISDEGTLADTARTGIFDILLAQAGADPDAAALRLARAMVECEAGEFCVGSDAATGTAFRFRFDRPL